MKEICKLKSTDRLRAVELIRSIPDFPEPGILFRDITPVLEDPDAFREVTERLSETAKQYHPDKILGIESRGFLMGAPVALNLGLGFLLARKPGKLPGATVRAEYSLEYGVNALELHSDAIRPGERIMIVDDLLATGGTARAAGQMVEQLGGVLAGYIFFIELTGLNGRDALTGCPVISLVQF